MELLGDQVFLARLQFAGTAIYHYLFVPLSVGIGLILAILMTKAYRSGNEHDEALATFWTKLFAVTFAVGVATGITMEFSFGTNWSNYSRFVGDIFGAPLAAEALFAFFLESVFLGVLLFGKKRVGKKFYLASSWLVWFGSCLSALWIIIANSWMQTPAGYEVVDGQAIMTNFFEAALNHSTMQRYFHVIVALLLTGSLVAVAIGAYYKLKGREGFTQTLLKVGLICGTITFLLMIPAGHQQAVEVSVYNPEKLAALEGQYQDGPADMSLVGWVDEDTQTTYSIALPGMTSWLATGDTSSEFQGLDSYDQSLVPTGLVNAIFQCYHAMVGLLGVVFIILVIGFLVYKGKIKGKWALWLMMIGWVVSLLAIEMGWCTAELGRQPWIVYGELLTADAVSPVVDPVQLVITLLLFLVIYTAIYIVWLKTSFKIVKAGPEACLEKERADAQKDEEADAIKEVLE